MPSDCIRVLLISGSDDDISLIRDSLGVCTGEIELQARVRSLAAAVKALRADNVDVIVLDPELADSVGAETVRAVHQVAGDTPIVVMIDANDEVLATEMMCAGAQDCIPKDSAWGAAVRCRLRWAVKRSGAQRSIAVREALRTANDIIRAVPAGILIYELRDGELVLESANPAAAPYILVPDAIGTAFSAHWPLPMTERLEKRLLELLDKGGLYDAEVTMDLGGGDRAFRARAFRISDARISIVFEDISAQKESERRFRIAAGIGSDLIYEWDVKTDRLTWYGDIDAALGYPHGMISASIDGWLQQMHEDDRRHLAEAVRQHRTETHRIEEEYRMRHQDGSWRTWVDRALPVIGVSGRPIRWIGACLDITEQREAENALRFSEAKYRSLFDHAILGIYQTLPDGRFLAANGALVELLGYKSFEELAELNLEEEWFGEEGARERFKEHMARGGEYRGHESHWRRRDGSLVYVRESGRAVRGAQGEVLYYEGTVEDITEQKRVERFLELARYSLDTADVEVYWIDLDGRFTFVNEAVIDRLGYRREDLIGKAVWEIDPEYSESRWRRQWKELKAVGTKRFETTHQRRDGSTYPVEITSHYLVFEGEQFEFAFAVDISARKAGEEALRQSEENYRMIFNSASDAIMLHDSIDGKILDCNTKTEELFGYSREEFADSHVRQFSSNEPPYTQQEALLRIRAAAAGTPQMFEWHCRRRDGSLFWVEVNLRQVELLRRSVVLAVVRDVSERKRLEAQLRQSQKLEAIGTLASGVAHEINNPLMGMINYAELIAMRTQDAALAEYAEEIKGEGTRMAGIVRNLLSFARQERETYSPARLIDIVEWTLSLVRALLRRSAIDVRVSVSEDLPRVQCRSQQIQQVLLNLLTNAKDALNERYPDPDPNKLLVISGEAVHHDGAPWVRMTVEDRGVGVSADIADRLFDPFFTTKPRDEGTGLGLSISYGIVREHGGLLTLETTSEGYTRFHVLLPIVEGDTHGDTSPAVKTD